MPLLASFTACRSCCVQERVLQATKSDGTTTTTTTIVSCVPYDTLPPPLDRTGRPYCPVHVYCQMYLIPKINVQVRPIYKLSRIVSKWERTRGNLGGKTGVGVEGGTEGRSVALWTQIREIRRKSVFHHIKKKNTKTTACTHLLRFRPGIFVEFRKFDLVKKNQTCSNLLI